MVVAGILSATPPAKAQTLQTNLAVTVQHAPSLNGNGRIEGSLQQLLGESATINGGFTLTPLMDSEGRVTRVPNQNL